jgi:hypothetical protein
MVAARIGVFQPTLLFEQYVVASTTVRMHKSLAEIKSTNLQNQLHQL